MGLAYINTRRPRYFYLVNSGTWYLLNDVNVWRHIYQTSDLINEWHLSFHQAPYLNNGPHYLRPQALRFRCSNHRLDIELGRHTNTPRQQRVCQSGSLADEYHVFKCTHFLDLQIYCDIQITSRPSFISLMLDFLIKAQRYISLVMSRIRHR